MSTGRRELSNREKQRLEEKEIDKQLKDAGFDPEGVAIEEKKLMLQMVEESKKSAQEEEDKRQKENQIFEETLSKSFSEKFDERGNKPTSSAKENATDILPGEVKPSEPITEQDELSDSGSTTPDLFPSPAGTPAKTASNREQILSGKSITKESPKSSRDLILFSQSSVKLGIEKNAIENCIESISVSESEDEDDSISCSPSVVNSSLPSNSGVSNRLSSSPSARAPLRTPKYTDICKSEIEESLMSPVIGQRHILPLKKADSTLVKEVNRVENVEMPDFICVKPLNPAEAEAISDVYRSEPGNSSSKVHQNELTECGKQSSAELTSVIEELPKKESHKRKCDVLEDDHESKSSGTSKLFTSASDGVSVKNSPKNTRKTPFLGLNLSDSDEDLNFLSKREKKKCVNVFFKDDSVEVVLKRHSGKSEDPEKAYFKSKHESICSGYERILCLFNKSYEKLEKYQSSLVDRMPWSAPIGVDRRVKDSLDRPKVSVKKRLDLPHSSDNEHPRMMTRYAPKSPGLREEYANLSDDSLPELPSTSSGWIDAKKTSMKRRGVQLGLSRKQARFEKTPESDDKTTCPVVSLNIINESDSEDFDVCLSKTSSNLKKNKLFSFEGVANEGIVSRVSPSAQVEEEQTNFEMGDILEDNPKSPVVLTRENKESSPVNGKNLNLGSVCKVEVEAPPSTSGIANKQLKRPRKTFSLSVESDEESSENTDRLVIEQDKSVVPSNEIVQMLPKELLPEQSVSEQKSYRSPLRESKVSSLRKKEPLQFLNAKDVESKDRLKTEEEDFENFHLVDRSECLPSTSKCSKTTTRARKGKGNSDPLKPGPLKLKTNRGRGAVKVESPEPVIEDQASPVLEIPPQDHINGLPENKIECPLCQRYFPPDKIEAHASDCLGPTEDTTVQQPVTNTVRTKTRPINLKNDDIMMINESSDHGGAKFGRVMSSESRRRRRERTPPNHARCSFCSVVFKEGDEYFIHVEDCKSRPQTSSSMSLNRTPGKLTMTYSASAVSSPIRPRRPIGKGTSVLEQLEGGSL